MMHFLRFCGKDMTPRTERYADGSARYTDPAELTDDDLKPITSKRWPDALGDEESDEEPDLPPTQKMA